MIERGLRQRPIVAVVIIAGLILIATVWWFLRGRFNAGSGTPTSPVQVFLISPASGQEIEAGDYLPIRTLAIAPDGVLGTELLIDGESLGPANGTPQNAWWIFRAWQPGLHTLQARAASTSGEVGHSPTVMLNVIAGTDTIEVLAGDGAASLQQIGVTYGIPPLEMVNANPHLDPNPSLSLASGERVRVPVPRVALVQPAAPGDAGDAPASIFWGIKFTEAVQRAYCYTRGISGYWYRLPQDGLLYFEGSASTYVQLLEPLGTVPIETACWGWINGDLTSLGSASAPIDWYALDPGVVLHGESFELTGTPGSAPGTIASTRTVPFPYSLRQTLGQRDCQAHGLSPERCEALLASAEISSMVLEWEWRAPWCILGSCGQATSVDGYRLYVMDTADSEPRHVYTIADPSQRVTALPLAYDSQCYGVRAYVLEPAFRESEMARYCPGKPEAQIVALEPVSTITTGRFSEDWFDNLAVPAGAVAISASNYGNEARSSAGVKFDLSRLPEGTMLNKALLRFAVTRHQQGTDANADVETFCADTLAVGLQDWTALSGGENRYLAGVDLLASPSFSAPVSSLPDSVQPSLELDVTAIVADWLEDPSTNHGFVFLPRPSPPTPRGGSYCHSVEGNFALEIDYLEP